MVPVTIIDPTVQSFVVYSGILGVKLLAMSFLTARLRHKKKVVSNEEDAKATKAVVKFDDPDIERVRRAHLNDLENIPVFWVLGALYLTTGPAASTAVTLFRLYAAGRILHTFVYAIHPIRQPARAIAFGIPSFITMYMGIKVITHYLSAL